MCGDQQQAAVGPAAPHYCGLADSQEEKRNTIEKQNVKASDAGGGVTSCGLRPHPSSVRLSVCLSVFPSGEADGRFWLLSGEQEGARRPHSVCWSIFFLWIS